MPETDKSIQKRRDAVKRLRALEKDMRALLDIESNSYMKTHYRQLIGFVVARRNHHAAVIDHYEHPEKHNAS